MSRARTRFHQGDISRAVKGATAAGLSVAKIEIDQDGKIVIVSAEDTARQEPATPLDAWKAKHARQA